MFPIQRTLLLSVLALAALVVGCGGSSKSGSGSASGTSTGALSADAKSAATGDIPDNQNFLTFADRSAGYSMVYPEGWAQRGGGRDVTLQDKNNLVHIVVASGSPPTPTSVATQLNKLRGSSPSLQAGTPTAVKLKGGPAIKVSYSTQSAPNPVTGKRVTLIVDRYVLSHASKVATVDLGTAKGVDNVDAYKMMIASFRWR